MRLRTTLDFSHFDAFFHSIMACVSFPEIAAYSPFMAIIAFASAFLPLTAS